MKTSRPLPDTLDMAIDCFFFFFLFLSYFLLWIETGQLDTDVSVASLNKHIYDYV